MVLQVMLLMMMATSYAQNDTIRIIHLDTVSVTEEKPSFTTTSKDIVSISNSEMKERGSRSLSEAIATLPGVSQLTTGGISKPVIRGVYGNRIQVNMAGIRLEDQEWEDEHGLGVSDIGIRRIELIKGPASLMFGSNAMGGVINIIEEDVPSPGEASHDLNLGLFSNSYAVSIDYGYKRTKKNTVVLDAGIDRHADYSDGSGERVPNTRFATYDLNLGYIFTRKRWKSDNRLLTSFHQFGFISDSSDIVESESEPRLSYGFKEAHSSILSTLLSSVNTLRINDLSRIHVSAGFQSNLRQEQERGNNVDLNLFLNTLTLNTSLEHQLSQNWEWTNGISGMFQTNKNLGRRIIIPDANIAEASAFTYIKNHHRFGGVRGNFEAGLRYDHRHIITFSTGSLNKPGSELPPFNKGFNVISGSVGESLIIGDLVLKLDLGSGFRTGNLAELSANGLHEGTPNWYVGDPELRVEQCLNADFSFHWNFNNFFISGSVFRNQFKNYIYLQPTNEEYFGFDIFRFEQTDAVFQGFESGIGYFNAEKFSVSLDYSFLNAARKDGTYLPLIPANRLLFDAKYYLPFSREQWKMPFISIGAAGCGAQDHTDLYEEPTPAYLLLNVGAGISYKSFRLILTGRNLTNRLYYDHLSRLKYYGMYDMGRSIVLNAGWSF